MSAVKESKLGDDVACICINIETLTNAVRKKVDRFFEAHVKDTKVIHLNGKPPIDYMVTYVPHSCAVDGKGKMLMNYKGGIDKAISYAAKAAGKAVPREIVKSSCTLV
mmetsp:Transcript_21757/g.42279  ORF Transcript_21757/g.42279 Transcript_21757/m.42279 type:complete len:108 (+) Transcript_21757:145-468(+)